MSKITIAKGSKPRRRNIGQRYDNDVYGNDFSPSKENFNLIHQTYRGRSDRLERYRMYEWMDQDSDISRALDLISEHCTERDGDMRYFNFRWITEEVTEDISTILNAHLDQWSLINRLEKQLFKIVRNTMKYGDWFLFRNPHTFKLFDLHPKDVLGAVVERNSLDILGWIVRDFRWNIEDMELDVSDDSLNQQLQQLSNQAGISGAEINARVIPAAHILHFSLSEGKTASAQWFQQQNAVSANHWPYGPSWLDKAFKTFKQRELLEDAAIIHRVQRAPSRLAWYLDVGKMRPDRAKFVVQNFKNEMNQKRTPMFMGDNSESIDSSYNPISQLEDYYIPIGMDSRGSKVEQLEGTPWNEMPDLDYFSKKMMTALRVPYAWLLPAGEGGITPSDGRVGQATQEEIEFSRFCSRIHTMLIETWDQEFKLYSKWRDVNVNWSDFELQFIPPTDYEASRGRARMVEAANSFSAVSDIPYISKRYMLKHFLDWTDDQIVENERMVQEEMGDSDELPPDADNFGGGAGVPLGDIPDGGEGLDADPMSLSGGDTGVGGGEGIPGGGLGGGLGEGNEAMRKRGDLIEDALEMPSPKSDYSNVTTNPEDGSMETSDPVAGEPIATLAIIQRLRIAHFNKRVEWEKRMLKMPKIYSPPSEGGDPGFGGL